MHKFILTVFIYFFACIICSSTELQVLNIQYDWINKDELAKEEMIQEVRSIIFTSAIKKRNDLKKLYKDKLKDKNHIENYIAASKGLEEFNGNNISAFYYKKMPYLYMYAIQDKRDTSNAFYYDAMGNLRYVDFIDGFYPDYPYTAVQYRINGKPISVLYYTSKDCQYLFKPNGDFEGVWYKDKLYNKTNKIILTRTTY